MITPRRTGSGALGTPQSGQRPSSARRRLQQATSAGAAHLEPLEGAIKAPGLLGAKNATPFSHDKLEGPTSSGKRFEPASPSVEDPFPKFLEDAGEARKSLDFSPAGVSRISEEPSLSPEPHSNLLAPLDGPSAAHGSSGLPEPNHGAPLPGMDHRTPAASTDDAASAQKSNKLDGMEHRAPAGSAEASAEPGSNLLPGMEHRLPRANEEAQGATSSHLPGMNHTTPRQSEEAKAAAGDRAGLDPLNGPVPNGEAQAQAAAAKKVALDPVSKKQAMFEEQKRLARERGKQKVMERERAQKAVDRKSVV